MCYTLAVRTEKKDGWTSLEVSYRTNEVEQQERKEFEGTSRRKRGKGGSKKKMTWSEA